MLVQIVDDNKKFRETLLRFITPIADEIIECGNGKEAVEAYAEHLPDFVLMDIKMPEMDGITAAKIIVERFPDARIILITDLNGPLFLKEGKRAGALAYFSKENLEEVKEFITNSIISKKKIEE